MMNDVTLLSRLQFAFTIAFHYIYPPLTIGLGVCLVFMEGMYLRTKNKVYEDLTRFWIKVFALIFGIGVATGIVMEFEFGTNWATYSRYVGDVFGSALAAEGIFAFALESGFLGILLFGWNRVSPRMHFIATALVALGSIFSAIWIVIANSWMQTPAGFRIEGHEMQARAVVTDFWAMLFNPSAIERLSHVLVGAFSSGAFLVLSVSAWYILKNKHLEHAKKGFKVGLWVAAFASVMSLFSGHTAANVVGKYQPTKMAAMEGHWDSLAPADAYMFGWVDKEKEVTHGIKLPGGLSFLLYFDFGAKVQGLKSFPKENRPGPVNFVFQTYHIMVVLGFAMIGLTLLALWLLYKRRLYQQRWLMWIFVFSVLMPQIANQTGWYSAEVGRQPWVVYGLLRTSDALSEAVTADQVLASLILFTLVYFVLFLLFLYLLNKKIQHGIDVTAEVDTSGPLSSKNPDLFSTAR